MLNQNSILEPANVSAHLNYGKEYLSLYFITTPPGHTFKTEVLHTCTVPESMPFKHAVAMAWDDLIQKHPLLAEQIRQGQLTVTLTSGQAPSCRRHSRDNWQHDQYRS